MARRALARSAKTSRALARELAPAAPAKRVIVGINVKFELNSKNGLRRVIFGLEKAAKGENTIWKIHFELYERDKKTTPYGDALIKLDLEVEGNLNKKAEDAAHGLTPGQSAHAIGPAADDAKAAQKGEIEEDEAAATIQGTLKKK